MPTPRPRRRSALLAATALVAALAPAGSASAQLTGFDALYLTADGNAASAIAHSSVAYTPAVPSSPPTEALLGTAANFADNLASGSLQGAAIPGGRPLFLNEGADAVDAEVLEEMARVLPEGATVHVLGGEAAISAEVAADLAAVGYAVNRLAGPTRTETAIAIAEVNQTDTVLVVRSDGEGTAQFADSLGAGALAATRGWDVLFSGTAALPATTEAALADQGYTTAYVVGGEAAISAPVFDAVAAVVPTVERVAGPTRTETAIALNGLRPQPLGGLAIAVDGNDADAWADAFPAANLSGLSNNPLVLTAGDLLPSPTAEYLDAAHQGGGFADHLSDVFALCGTTVPTSTCQAIADLQRGLARPFDADGAGEPQPGPGTEGVVDRTELVGAAVGDLGQGGLAVTYAFDEPIVEADVPQVFVLHAGDGTTHVAGSVLIEDDPTAVTALFPDVLTQDQADAVSLATVGQGVAAADGRFNVQGAIGVGDPSSTTPGAVPDPQLEAVSVDGGGVATFTFDEAIAGVENEAGFDLFLPDGTQLFGIQCAGSVEDGSAVVCSQFGSFEVPGADGGPVDGDVAAQAVLGSVDSAQGFAGAVVTAADDGAANTFGAVPVTAPPA